MDELTELIKAAVARHGIDVPVSRAERVGNVLRLYLYGHMEQPKEIAIEDIAADLGLVEPDDLTVINGIGQTTAERLAAFGIRTFAELAAADVEAVGGVTHAGPSVIMTWQAEARKRL